MCGSRGSSSDIAFLTRSSRSAARAHACFRAAHLGLDAGQWNVDRGQGQLGRLAPVLATRGTHVVARTQAGERERDQRGHTQQHGNKDASHEGAESAVADSRDSIKSAHSTPHESHRPGRLRNRLAAGRAGERFCQPIGHPAERARGGDSLAHGHRCGRRVGLRRLEPLMLRPLRAAARFCRGVCRAAMLEACATKSKEPTKGRAPSTRALPGVDVPAFRPS